MKRRFLVFALIISLSVFLLSCDQNTVSDEQKELYAGFTTDADVMIDMPALRQYGGYSCGTTCVQMIMNYLFPYEGDVNLADYEKELGTTEDGTAPRNVVRFLKSKDVSIKAGTGMTADELVSSIDRGHPVMMGIQAWSTAEDGSYNTDDPSDKKTYLIEGHWVICVGYEKNGEDTTFYFNDPACVGHCVMSEKELEERWIDMGNDGRIYERYGIEIIGKTQYHPDGVFHLD